MTRNMIKNTPYPNYYKNVIYIYYIIQQYKYGYIYIYTILFNSIYMDVNYNILHKFTD